MVESKGDNIVGNDIKKHESKKKDEKGRFSHVQVKIERCEAIGSEERVCYWIVWLGRWVNQYL